MWPYGCNERLFKGPWPFRHCHGGIYGGSLRPAGCVDFYDFCHVPQPGGAVLVLSGNLERDFCSSYGLFFGGEEETAEKPLERVKKYFALLIQLLQILDCQDCEKS